MKDILKKMTEKWRYETGFGSVRLMDSDEIVAMPFAGWDAKKRDKRGRLIAAAPEMYASLKAIADVKKTGTIISVKPIKELLERIDGEVDNINVKNKS